MSAFSIPQLPDSLNREFDVENEAAAKVLLDARYRTVLAFFTRQENTVTALAAYLEIPVSNAYYYVKVLESLKIIEVVVRQKRAGKPLKVYSCAADSYFIPSHIAPAAVRDFFAAAEAPWSDLLKRSIEHHVYEREGWGLRFFRDDVGNLHTASTPRRGWRNWEWLELDFLPDQAAIFAAVVPLSLNRTQAKTLQADLGQLFQKYYLDVLLSEDKAAEPRYLMRLELAPMPTR